MTPKTTIPAPAYPLTYAQESLFFLQQLTRGEPVYNMPQAFRLRGALHIPALEKALQSIVARHDALRIKISGTDQGPRQSVAPGGASCFRLHAVSESDVGEKLKSAARERFDLENGPVFRVDLFKMSETEHVLLLNLHHIVGDMASLGIIFKELSYAYNEWREGREPQFGTPPLQIGVYASERRGREVPQETVNFWRENLADVTSELELPLDRFRPKYPTFQGAAQYFDLAPELRNQLGELARKNRSSLYMVCLSALEALLYRYSGQQRFTLATPFTDREDPKLEQTIGYLVNLLPIACDVRAENTFRQLLGSVRAQCLSVYAHHDISFRQIIQELALSSDSPKPSLARVVFQYFPEIASLQLVDLECTPLPVHSATSKFDLCVSMWESAGNITTEIEYDTDIYEDDTIKRFSNHFVNVLQAAARDPDQQIGDLPLADTAEQELIDSWSFPRTNYPAEATVHELFEEQARRTPENVALVYQSQQITYRELDQRANRLAQRLRKSGVKPGDFVGVCLERSPELIAALIGILKAGGAYVPFEASYPKARLEYLFADSAVRVLVTDSKHAAIAHAQTEAILLDQNAPLPDQAPLDNAVSAESAAYMMYTSGSTGTPKGTIIPHRAIVRLVKNNDFTSFGPDEVCLAFAPVSFDASTLEIWSPLLNGGTLAVYPPNFDSVEQFEEVLKRHGVTKLWLTAGLFNTIVDRKVQSLRGVRQLLVGGDVLSSAHIRKALDALPDTELINGYGPTENTTFTCCYRIPRDFTADRSVPIGRPIQNTSVYILDERLHKTAINVPGELYTGGAGLSLGYWRKPELTEKSFLPNPFAKDGKLYRTGDRARYRNDGTIEFLGRRDSQVKIRGFRIEIEEVEAAFRKLPSVQDVAVVAHPDASGTKSLVGYVVLKQNALLRPADLQAEVGRHLPTHACPSRILLLSELPLGPNGKVNRASLPAPAHLPAAEAVIAQPTNEIEEKLVQLWRQILEVPALGIDDNFFHLGGESLRATRAVSQMNATFNCRLSLPRMFEAPTIRQMAQLVVNSRNEPMMPTIKGRPRKGPEAVPDISRLTEQDVDTLLSQLLATNDSAKK